MDVVDWQSGRVSVAEIAEIIGDIAGGELHLSPRREQALPPVLRDAFQRLIRSIRARRNASSLAESRDELTALLSTSCFKQTATERLVRADRCHALLLIDLVDLGRINDTSGYSAGDQLLALAAARISHVLDTIHLKAGGRGDPPLIGRLGGDEFVALVEVEEVQDAEGQAVALINALREPFYVSQRAILIGSNIGLAMVPDHALSYDPLLRHAKLALQDSGRKGPNRVTTFDQAMADEAQRRAALESALGEALIEEQFELYFQPIVRIGDANAQPIMEALIRWRHPEHGIIMPADFVPLAEACGLIGDIGRWVLATAMKTIVKWQEAGCPCTIAVNVAAEELAQPEFIGFVREWLVRTGADPRALEIEVTETAVTTASHVALDNLQQLSALGVRLAIDDFGTGHSNFARLSQLPFDRLKVDQSLAREASGNTAQREVVSCIVQLGRALGHEVVIEGIESEAEVSLFTAMGCHLLQGYHYSLPLPENAVLPWLANSRPHSDDGRA
ncbi:putative bifunctional diguanylate cyclase/phosphodiesterase [Sphingomonas floccifaciens]|uniref:Bifunctional diguanylate cyclase/phosphodiesterase n=1 Tax=Sphingomonas floccifaciens TaxID=1844115 RepID=A0ABW4NDK0_9SPHN